MLKRTLTPHEQRAAASLAKLSTGTLRLTLAGAQDSKPVLARLIYAELEQRKAAARSAAPAAANPPNEKAPVSPGARVPESAQGDASTKPAPQGGAELGHTAEGVS